MTGSPVSASTFSTIADRIVADFAPAAVLDAGCSSGLLVQALRERGVQAWGIDTSEHAIGTVAPAVRPYCHVGSAAAPLKRRYDVIITMEVVQHLSPMDADRAIGNFAAHSDHVLFSSSPFDLRDSEDKSVRPAEHWAEAFARLGLFRDTDYDAGYITPWAIHYRRDALTMPALVRRYERWGVARDQAAREARAQARETLHALAKADTQLERLAWLETKSHELVQEVQARTLERDDAAFERQRALEQLGHTHTTIRAMESSLFWRARKPWAALSRRLRGK